MISRVTDWFEGAVWPLDAMRRRILRHASPRWWVERARRVTCMLGLSWASALAMTLLWPAWAFAWGPLLLGVVHLLSDVRYLVLQPQLHRNVKLLPSAAALLAVTLGAPVWVGCLAMPLAALVGTGARRWWVAVVGFAASVAAAQSPLEAQLLVLYGHNVMALLMWAAWPQVAARSPAQWLWLGLIGLTAVLLLWRGDAVARAWLGPDSLAPLHELASQYAPTVDPVQGLNWLLSFVFLQAMHYAVWLRLVPEEARRRPAPRSFRSTVAALRGDVGTVGVGVVLLSTLALVGWACIDLEGARLGYLHAATWHGYLELAVAARWLAGAR